MCHSAQPFSLVENAAFREYSHELNSSYKLPCVQNIKSQIVYEAQLVRSAMKSQIQDIQYGACICIDIWSSDAQDSYLGIDLHFITQDFKLEDLTLCIKPFEYPHTTTRLAGALNEVFHDFGLHSKATALMTDNGSNMLALKNHFPNLDLLRCSIHTLQLSAKSLFESNNGLLTRSRNLVAYFCHSNKQNEALMNIQQGTRSGMTAVSYVKDMPVRWSSTCSMLERILELRTSVKALNGTLLNATGESNREGLSLQAVLLSDADYAKITLLLGLLDPLAEVSTILQATKYVTLSLVYPFIAILLHIYEKPIEDEEIDNTRKTILCDLKERWGSPSDSILIACFLDPRFKNLQFVNEEQKSHIMDQVRIIYRQEHTKKEQLVLPIQSESKVKLGIFSHFQTQPAKKAKEYGELEKYLEAESILESTPNFDILNWWRVNEPMYPHLSVLARRYLCRMPSTASIEGAFSVAGFIIGVNRCSLDVDIVDDLLVLKRHYRSR